MMITRYVTRTRLAALVIGATLLGATSTARAQGTLSTQGFGYPVGALSIRSIGTGGAFGEFDAISPINPSSLGGMERSLIAAQAEPEYRTLRIGGVTEKNTIQRVPLLLVALPLRRNMSVAFSASSFLDRSFSTRTNGAADLGDEIVETRDEYSVRGAMADMRGALGYRINARLSVGVAGHLIMGSHDAAFARRFVDSARFGAVVDSSTISFQGTAVSVGADVRLLDDLAVSASYRLGNSIDARLNRTEIGRGKVPSRLGATVRYEGIRGSVFALGVEQVQWSALDGLGTTAVEAHDATNWHAGAEVAGPQLRQLPVQFRAGYARAQLPFGVSGNVVNEQRIAGGVGIPLDHNFRASLDLSVQRVMRSLTGTGDAKENAWRFGLGLQIRP